MSWWRFDDPDRPLEQLDWVVFGVPFEDATCGRRGCKFGPSGIRQSARTFELIPITEKMRTFDGLAIRDIGDLEPVPRDIEATHSLVEEQCRQVATGTARCLMLGGDHSLTAATVKALGETAHEPFGILWVDAHVDVYDELDGTRLSHGCPLRRCLEYEWVDPEATVVLGARQYDRLEVEYLEQSPVTVIGADEVSMSDWREVLRRVRDVLSLAPSFYFSFDVDGLDPAYAPGTGYPVPGGLSPRHLYDVVHFLGDAKAPLIGADVVEVAPAFDVDHRTCAIAAKFVIELLGASR